jgi:glycosyltransferase involved in cell wall biosynthesis
LGAGEADVVFLTAAFLTPRKGIDVLLRAFADVARARSGALLWIAGDEVAAHAEYAAGLRRFVETHGLRGRVRFLGHREDVAVLLHAADVFVLASRNEALPLTIAEAMMAARPVVATNVGSVAGMVEDGKTGALAPVENVGALAAKMIDFTEDRGLREEAGRRGRERALRQYDREALLDRAEALLHAITGAGD